MRVEIKNMVCRHCVTALENVLRKLDIPFRKVEIGYVDFVNRPTPAQLLSLDGELSGLGFERIENMEQSLVERAKLAVMHHVRDEAECKLKLSACIEEQVGVPFDTISRIFSQLEGRTIEKYHIAQKVERVKELLAYGGRTLEEIADITGYSSAAHLSRQFKAVTGLTPTAYISGERARKSLDKV
ncbi:MAG: AraC family transcriptional regulator [Muribaculaceae bacterium]|nr:AraC family transcriptional regulator [Muribaculaceae bacterium]